MREGSRGFPPSKKSLGLNQQIKKYFKKGIVVFTILRKVVSKINMRLIMLYAFGQH